LLSGGVAMVNFYFLFVVVSSNGRRTSSWTQRFLATRVICAKGARELCCVNQGERISLQNSTFFSKESLLRSNDACPFASWMPGQG